MINKINRCLKIERRESMKVCRVLLLMIFSLTAIFLTGVSAENRAGAVSVSPLIGGYVFDDEQSINSDPAYGAVLGYNITERIGIEAAFNYVDTDLKSAGKESVDAFVYRLEALYHFMADKDVLPYIAVGGGAITIDVDGVGDETDYLANYGGGIKFFLTESLAFRVGVRHIISFDETNHNLLYKAGLSYLIGAKPEKAAPPPPKPEPMDSDGDGVTDDMDSCANTPSGVQVDGSGCPVDSDGDGVSDDMDQCTGTPTGVAVDGKGCPMDSDGDGVPDSRDRCSGTPSRAAVDSSGCPLDSDKDGVYDYQDNCPRTARGIKVDAAGCPLPIKEKVSIEMKVDFDTNSAVVKNAFHDHIEKVANFLKTYPDTTAVIEGHTDSAGNDGHNLKLSEKRALNVMQHLVDFGIHPSRIKAEGYGESRPIADNSTAEGRQMNRRVVAVISTIIEKMP